MSEPNKAPLIILGGATASGKSDVGVKIAEKIGAEIISADSIQVYKYFDIGSAKPSTEMMKEIPHHLIDVAYPEEEYTLVRFREEAEVIIEQVLKKGKLPLVVGGTGLYVKALLEGLSGGVKVSNDAEQKMDEIVAREGLSGLYQIAESIDPEPASKVHPNDTYRVRRIVGVPMTIGKRLSDLWKEEKNAPKWDSIFLWLAPPRSLINERIDNRVDLMLQSGWRDEVERLICLGYNEFIKPMRSLGYKTLYEEAMGRIDRSESSAIIKKDTRAFAKRQTVWFRGTNGARPVTVREDENADVIAERILADDFVAKQLSRLTDKA